MKSLSDTQDTSMENDLNNRTLWSKAWPWIKRALTLGFFCLIAWLIYRQAQSVDWAEVKQSLLEYSGATVALGLAFAAGAYLIYSSYDLFGRYYIRTNPSRLKTMAVAFVSFAFNLNLGALVGSIALRYRLYTRIGLSNAEIAHVVGMTVSTNWLGYLLLAGTAFAAGAVSLPFDWGVSGPALRALGAVFITVVAVYVALCRFSKRRTLHIRGHELTLPSTRVAGLQLLLSCSHWALIASVVHTFLPQVDFLTLLGVLLVSSIAGAVAHIPGGLGVLEAVFIALLSGGDVTRSQILAALIAYRAVFYLCPLALAVLVYFYIELKEMR